LYHLREPEYDALIAYIDGTAKPQTTPAVVRPPAYTDADFVREVYLAADELATLKALLTHKHNLILQGAPGVGKTFAAKRLTYAIMGAKDDARMLSVQFHQNSSYEDFVMGYRPHDDGFALEYGAFYAMCQRASNDPAQPYFVIIDEINRGNISKIFGELLMLIEHDYRGTAMTLTYDKQPFAVPQNLYIIGMMNTADRSLALIDYALRRRFSFFEMQPGFTTDGFGQYQHSLNSRAFDDLITALKALNTDIASDPALGNGFRIGHSSVCNLSSTNLTQRLGQIVDYDIIPLLLEYWFDDQAKVDQWAQRLKGAVRG
jgi:5-methylcytosine-specific restriction protein B